MKDMRHQLIWRSENAVEDGKTFTQRPGFVDVPRNLVFVDVP